MKNHIRVGYSRSTSTGSHVCPVEDREAVVARMIADDSIVNAYYYPHPSSAAVWVKGDSESHRKISDSAVN